MKTYKVQLRGSADVIVQAERAAFRDGFLVFTLPSQDGTKDIIVHGFNAGEVVYFSEEEKSASAAA